jgi:hypothetical protein
MNQDESKKSDSKLEGEGSYSATRRYNQHLGEAIDSGDIETAADEARRAIDGPEGSELKRAEQQGKAGPKLKQGRERAQKPTRPT